ncbi:MAG: hypothetical protein US36_C0014G0005 [Candidatus Wolfebacteria bacterium GW2011_GWC1_37_10]|uniref:Uncharacterized protein n=1 Tax=Candidatus Wolfebacteria bacterium GW2011_GWC1_37_10 TaxID=1619010 RepID=A0A0G0G6U4_9BACT|nr:MAG: hypothetical protein US36_C0014G0005 [Candidatus Wolfebacteria bacterium GW2011_GWC1_37_10]
MTETQFLWKFKRKEVRKMERTTSGRNFLGVNLSDIDINKLPTSLACITDNVIETRNGDDADIGHFYHSDQPSYDHTRDD